MQHGLKIGISLLVLVTCTACETTSPTEEDFGNSVRNAIAKQTMESQGTLAADEPLDSGDGRRLTNVTSVYQNRVGDPSPVVKQVEVRQEASGQP